MRVGGLVWVVCVRWAGKKRRKMKKNEEKMQKIEKNREILQKREKK